MAQGLFESDKRPFCGLWRAASAKVGSAGSAAIRSATRGALSAHRLVCPSSGMHLSSCSLRISYGSA